MTPFEQAVYTTYFESGHRSSSSPVLSAHCFTRLWERYLPPNRSARFLDLGCGEGSWLSQLRSVLGYEHILGVDGSDTLVKQARANDVPIAQSDIKEFLRTLPSDVVFDCISLFHVLEHFSPVEGHEILAMARDHLAPGGRCLLRVPNVLCTFTGMPFGDITHRTYFTTSSLSQLCWISGFGPLVLIPNVICGGSLRSRVRGQLAKALFAISRIQYGIANGFGSAGQTTFEPEIVCMVSPRIRTNSFMR